MLVPRSDQTYCVDYSVVIYIAEPMDTMFSKIDFRQVYLGDKNIDDIIDVFQKSIVIRGTYAGLSKLLLVHPSMEPSTKFDGSFIS